MSSTIDGSPERRGWAHRRSTRIGLGSVLVVAAGVGAYFIAASVSSPASPASARPSGPSGASRPRGAFGAFGGPSVVGVVGTVSSGSFTLKTANGTDTVETSSGTAYAGGSGDRAALKSGERVVVFGTQVSSTTIDATRVVIGAPGARGFGASGPRGAFGGGRRGVFGSVQSVGSSSFTVSSFNGTTYTVEVTSATTYSSASGSLSGVSALKKGDDVIVQGTASGSTVKASAVRVFTPGSRGGFGGGGFGGGGFGGSAVG